MISLAEKNTTFDAFKAVLLKNGAEFTVSVLILVYFIELFVFRRGVRSDYWASSIGKLCTN